MKSYDLNFFRHEFLINYYLYYYHYYHLSLLLLLLHCIGIH